jgi:hypothetical protein
MDEGSRVTPTYRRPDNAPARAAGRSRIEGGSMKARRTALLAATTAAIFAGGAAYAAIPDGAGVLHGCYKTNGGQLRLVNSQGDCSPSETPTQWNQVGPTGPSGPAGAQGAPGTFTGTFESPNHEYSVSVTDDGIVLKSSGAKISIDRANIKIDASGTVKITGSTVDIN